MSATKKIKKHAKKEKDIKVKKQSSESECCCCYVVEPCECHVDSSGHLVNAFYC